MFEHRPEAYDFPQEPQHRPGYECPGGALAPIPGGGDAPTRRPRRWLYLGAGVMAIVAGMFWLRSAAVPPSAGVGTAALWNVELASAGARPVTALVFGGEAGVHLVRLPAASAAQEERRRVSARLARGDIFMVSLGRHSLNVQTASPAGSAPMAFTASARFVKLSQDPAATRIKTGWW